jgi:hypothetical protein
MCLKFRTETSKEMKPIFITFFYKNRKLRKRVFKITHFEAHF